MKTLSLLLLASAALWTSGFAAPVRIMLLGDSLTAQMEARKMLYDQLTAEKCDFEFVGSQGFNQFPGDRHEGHGGFTIGPDQSEPGNLFNNVDAWIPAAQPDVIMLLVGNNDYNGKAGVDPATAPERLSALIEKIATLAPRATILVGSVLKIAWVDDYAGELNRNMPRIVKAQQASGRNVQFVDLHEEIDLKKSAQPPYDGPDGDYVDGTHLNATGAQKLAAGWYAHLRPLLSPSQNINTASGTSK